SFAPASGLPRRLSLAARPRRSDAAACATEAHPATRIAGNPRKHDLLRIRGNLQPVATGSRGGARRPQSEPRPHTERAFACERKPRLPAAAPVCPGPGRTKVAGSPHDRADRRVHPRHFLMTPESGTPSATTHAIYLCNGGTSS